MKLLGTVVVKNEQGKNHEDTLRVDYVIGGGGGPYNKNRGKYRRVSSFRNAANLLQTKAVCRILTCGTAHKVLATGNSL